ncbi:putative sulfonate ABC transporter periplasmic substrate-binding protein [Halanaeroarchaeum sulfurireducens]|uniref:Putative sulfonate ABC transporter periplasmic substrate-binding protein n=2 Tax=Halanaeroarchaeum sulfurireducens TaxID=1604004 RepID=A0A0F7P8N9_9EURY|nr:putative sulfonate ABC transporter periplasmic substrate-binding protein [Halanaeroarchaeum sulfurireducens]
MEIRATMNRRAFLGSLGSAVLASAAGCSALGRTSTTDPSLRLAYDAAPPHFQAVVMKREGWFDELPVPVEDETASCNSIVQLLVSGQADIGMIGTIPALVVIDSETPAHAVSASSKNAFVVLVDESVADLFEPGGDGFSAFEAEAGRPFELGTYPKGSVSDITARYWIQEERGESLDDVSLVHLGGPGAARQALLSGEVDGAVIPEPTPTLIERTTTAPYRRITDVGEFIPGEPAGVTVVRDEFASEHPDAVEAFIGRHAEATAFIQNEPDEAAEYMSAVYGGESALDVETARAALDSPATEYVTDPHDISSGMEILAKYAHRLGKTETAYGTDRIFDTQYYDRTVE